MRVRGRELPRRPARGGAARTIWAATRRSESLANSSRASSARTARRGLGAGACSCRQRSAGAVHQMKLGFGRIVKADDLAAVTRVALEIEEKTLPRGQIVQRVVLEAAERARALIAAAEAQAAKLIGDAERA